MKLGALLKSLPHEWIGGSASVPVSGICYDSREAGEGDLFVAVSGFKQDGHVYLPEAVGRGATTVVGSKKAALQKALSSAHPPKAAILVKDTREALAHLSAAYYGHPSRKLRLFGVTGTNGKTSTTYMLHHALTHIDGHAALFGTIENRIGHELLQVRRTTPESLDLERLLARCLQSGVKAVAMEVSSHALDLKRVHGVDFTAGLFTNLTQDHLDFHGTLARYFHAKKKLFADYLKPAGKPGVINIDCPYGRKLAAFMGPLAITFGADKKAAFRLSDARLGNNGLEFSFSAEAKTHTVSLPVPGLFHAQNALGAIALMVSVMGVNPAKAVSYFADFKGVPGRFEPVMAGQDFWVVVDYAHTPAGVENVLHSARALNPKRIITVLGCGGDRDKGKRPLMGCVAEELGDHTVITSDNPRSEAPAAIIKDILGGLKNPRRATVVEDRAKAIGKAIGMAKKGDIVVIAGKGHETEQIFSDHTIHFDDREVARAVLEGRR